MPAPLTSTLAVAGPSVVKPLMQAKAAGMSLEKIKQVASEFESAFLGNMLEEMFAGVEDGDPFANTEGAETWRSMRTDELAKSISRAGGIGLAAHVERHLISLQENKS
jgi:Rod binding domain-containing protein